MRQAFLGELADARRRALHQTGTSELKFLHQLDGFHGALKNLSSHVLGHLEEAFDGAFHGVRRRQNPACQQALACAEQTPFLYGKMPSSNCAMRRASKHDAVWIS